MEDVGNKVSVHYADEVLNGILITTEPHIILKLSSGYNIVLDKKKITKMETITKKKDPERKTAPAQQKNNHTVSLLHTGGTIASKVDYTTGAVIAQFSPEDILSLFPEITEHATINSRLISNIQSEMMRYHHYNILAEAIAEEIKKGVSGIIITHGTDTLHYTSAALSFMLDNPPVPIIIVGSQRSSDRPSSDAKQNLLSALFFITTTHWKGIGICMHENMDDENCLILPGLKVRKMHTSRRDAFKPINAEPVARINYEKRHIDLFDKTEKSVGPFSLKKIKEDLRVGIFKSRTHMFADELLFYKNYDGLIIEGFAIGHMPTEKIDSKTGENEKIYDTIKKLCEKMPVAFASQCIYGRTFMHIYTPGRELLKAGVLGDYCDMTPETAYIKLAYLLSNHPKEKVKELFNTNLKGEISERT
jgi:glutamyl-tRNA(Gln) amidotransferase subunit D